MKHTLISFIILLLVISNSVFSQEITNDSTFWVIVSNNLAEKSNSGIYTNSPSVNTLFENYSVSSYQKALPFAKTPMLQQVYEIECDCYIDSLILEIENNYQNYFSGIRKLSYNNTTLYDPIDNMWSLTISDTNNWLWHLKIIEADKAWDLTHGSPSVTVAIIDTYFDLSHPDLTSKFNLNFDPYDSIVYNPCSSFHSHGTKVASFVGAETTEVGGTVQGQLASVGFNTRMIGYKALFGNYLKRALHASSVMNVQIITSSAGGWTSCPDASGIEKAMVKEILNNGTTIIMPAGNGVSNPYSYNFCAQIDSVNHSAYFPLSPYYDERIILVSSTGKYDKHQYINSIGNDITHSHYPDVDLCSPGHELMGAVPTNCSTSSWPYYGSMGGTSFATPIVAGVAALMYSVNPCISPAEVQNMLKNTTDPILDASSYPNGVGTGRVNAFRAVQKAKSAYSPNLDLYIKDRADDFGNEIYPYHWQADRYDSPDIWVRNQNDGRTNHQHQKPEYSSSAPVYVYIRVRNKSCSSSTGTEKLNLYWSKASSMSSWPQNWDGTQPAIGNSLGAFNVGILQSGKDTILEIPWHILNPHIFNNWSTCLLARIENSPNDVITLHPNRLDDDVFYNNSIAMRNLAIVDNTPGILPEINGVLHPIGTFVLIGNSLDDEETFDIEFSTPDIFQGNSIIDEAEVKVYFDETGWDLLSSKFENRDDIEIIDDKTILLKTNKIKIENIEFPSETRVPIYIGFSFLSDELSDKNVFKYHLRQFLSNQDAITKVGEEHFEIRRTDRDAFSADAGDDQEVIENENTDLHAKDISEPAIYNWYDSKDSLIYSGKDFTVSSEITEKFKLEVIASSDGTKDYDEVIIKVKDCYISSMSPNPATNLVTIDYKVKNVTSAYLMVLNTTATSSNNYIININQNQINFNVSSYPTGSYSVILVCDGKAVDMKTLIVQ